MSLVTPHQFQLTSTDGLQIACTRWNNRKTPRGIIQITYGMGGHLGRYLSLIEAFGHGGLVVFGNNHYLGETRRSIWNLRSPTLQSTEDLSTALLEAIARALAGTAIRASFSVQGAPRKLGSVLEHHLLRICEETLANVVKHAHATRVEIVLHLTSKEVQLQIQDNGCGLEPTSWEVSKRGHFGLLGIRERVAAMFGRLSVDRAPGRGSRLLLPIPTKGTLRVSARKIPEDRCIADALRHNDETTSCSPRNSKELVSIHLVEEFTPPPIRASVLRMKIDCEREFEDTAEAQQGSFGEGLTGTFKSVLNNPVLPSEFDFFARSSRRAQPDVYSPATSKCEGSA